MHSFSQQCQGLCRCASCFPQPNISATQPLRDAGKFIPVSQLGQADRDMAVCHQEHGHHSPINTSTGSCYFEQKQSLAREDLLPKTQRKMGWRKRNSVCISSRHTFVAFLLLLHRLIHPPQVITDTVATILAMICRTLSSFITPLPILETLKIF